MLNLQLYYKIHQIKLRPKILDDFSLKAEKSLQVYKNDLIQ
jgi:hypothetical protein